MYLRGRRIGWHTLNVRFEFFNLPPTRISSLSSKKGDSDKKLLEAFTISWLVLDIRDRTFAPFCKYNLKQ